MSQSARLHRSPPRSASGLDRHPLLRGGHAVGLRELLRFRRLEAGSTLVEEGEVPDRVAFLISGSVRSVLTSGDGRQALTRLTLAPAVLGALEAWTGLASPVSVLAMEISQVAILPVDHFRRTVAQSPDLNRAWLLMLAEDQRFMFEQHRRVLFEGLQRRLAQLLLQLVHTYGLPVPGGRRVRIRLRHEDLADYLGAARRSVTRILTDWRVRGWVLHEAGSFTVARPEALVEIRGESTGQVTPLFGR